MGVGARAPTSLPHSHSHSHSAALIKTMPLSRSMRFLTLLLAAIQFAAPALVSIADGAFAKQVRDPGMHVESTGSTDCTPPHASDCAVCRFLSGNVGEVQLPGALGIPAGAQPTPPALVADATGTVRQGFDARGPPSPEGLI